MRLKLTDREGSRATPVSCSGYGEMRVTQSGPMIDIAGIHKTFVADHGTVTALEPLTIDVRPGEFIAIVGPSGCGKSTLLRLISGLDHPSGGTIRPTLPAISVR